MDTDFKGDADVSGEIQTEDGKMITFTGRVTISGRTTIGNIGDTTAPVISSVSSGTPNATSVTITWTTDEASTSVVNYGLTAGYGSSASDAAYVTSHSLTITGLSASTTYHYAPSSVDAAGNTSAAEVDRTFATAASGVASNPSCGNQTTTNFPAPTRYQSFITGGGSIVGNGSETTVITAAAHGLSTNHWVRITGTTAYNTAKGSPVQITKDSDTQFRFTSSVNAASETAGFVVWIPAPTAGSTYVDPIFGCTVRRLLASENSAAKYAPPYGAWHSISPDNSKMIVVDKSVNCFAILNLSDGSVYRTYSELATAAGVTPGLSGGQAQMRWLTNSTVSYTVGKILKEINIDTLASATVIKNFATASTTCTGDIETGNTGDWDSAKDKIVFRCNSAAGQKYFVYTKSTDAIGTPYIGTTSSDFSFIVDNGNFFINWGPNGTGAEQGIWYYNGTTGAAIRQITRNSQHSIPVSDGAGNHFWFGADTRPGTTACGTLDLQGIITINFDTLAENCIAAIPNLGRSLHFTATSSLGANPGWVLVGIQHNSNEETALVQNLPTDWSSRWDARYNEIFTIKVDGTGLYRLAHTYTRNATGIYERSPFGNISADGKYVIFRSSFGLCDGEATPCTGGNNWTESAVIQIRS